MPIAVVAELIIEYNPPISMQCTNAAAIERGTLLTLSDPFTVAAITDSTTAHAGIAAEEKITLDGKTKVSVHRDGIFRVSCSGDITVGEAVAFEDNYAVPIQVNHEHTGGIALETAANDETFLIELRPDHKNLA